MKSKIIGNELFIAVDIILSPMERMVFEKLSEGMAENRKHGKRTGLTTLRKMLLLDWNFTEKVINNLMNKISFAYELKKEKTGGYTYYILYQKKNI